MILFLFLGKLVSEFLIVIVRSDILFEKGFRKEFVGFILKGKMKL